MINKLWKKDSYGTTLILVVLFGLILRLYQVDSNPPSLNWDEVSHGYNAFSILITGQDEWGNFLPFIFKAYGDYKLPVYIYTTVLSIFFFGINEFSVRLPSVISGTLLIVFTYLLAKQLFNSKVGLISAFLVTIEPWTLFLSRGAFEANMGLTFCVMGIYFFISGIDRTRYLPISAILLGLSMWTYNSYRVFVPLFVITLGFIYLDDIKRYIKDRNINMITYFTIMFMFILGVIIQVKSGEGQARFQLVTILDQGAIYKIEELRNNSEMSPLVTKLIYNRPVYYITEAFKNWASHYNPEFLFTKGGSHYQFNIPNHGILYIANLLTILMGIFYLVRSKTKKSLVIFLWLIIGPLASSITREAPHTLRAISTLPIPMILSSLGIIYLSNLFKNKTGKSIFFAVVIGYFLFSLSIYLSVLFGQYKQNYSWAWQYGYKDMTSYVNENYNNYDSIIISKKYGEPHEYLLFYGANLNAGWKWNPKEYNSDSNLIRFGKSNWFWVDQFDKFKFINDWQVPKDDSTNFTLESGGAFDCKKSRCLLITSPDNFPSGWKLVKQIKFLDGTAAFDIVTNSIQ